MPIAQSQAPGSCDDCCWDSELRGMRCCMSRLIPLPGALLVQTK